MKPNNNETNLTPKGKQVATLAGGCFWCLDPIYAELQGVEKVEVGYSGGRVPNPSYQLVCTGTTGHAEAVQIWFDPQVISYKEILEIFFTFHDPTTLNRQGADVGTQYRSAIFYHTDEQKATAEQVIQEMQAAGIWDGSFVTELTPFETFFKAEDYHQDYFKKNPNQGYCRVIIAPKVAKFRKKFTSKLKKAESKTI
jgi:peptide-methionine (S)-S-oxide reductase